MTARLVEQADVERWILQRGDAGAGRIDPGADLVDGGYIDDFSLVELVFVLGALTGRRVDIQALDPGELRTLDGLAAEFLAGAAPGRDPSPTKGGLRA